MVESTFNVVSQLFKSSSPSFSATVCHENNLNRPIIDDFLNTVSGDAVGMAPAYDTKNALTILAFATPSQALLVRVKSRSRGIGPNLLQRLILLRPDIDKYAFRMDRLSAAIYSDLDLRFVGGIDLLSVSKADRHSTEALMDAMGGEMTLNKPRVVELFKHEEKATAPLKSTALQAWAALHAGTLSHMKKRHYSKPRIDTLALDDTRISLVAKTIRDADRLVALKPTKVKNEIESKVSTKKGNLEVVSTRFKTRVMPTSGSQKMEIEVVNNNGKNAVVTGRATKVNGRSATLNLQGSFSGQKIKSVTTVGREAPTSAEAVRDQIMLQALQRTITILHQPFVQKIWLPNEQPSWTTPTAHAISISLHFPSPRSLNKSQTKAVNLVLSNHNKDRAVLIHGPPGTGKTTVIAACVTSVMSSSDRGRTLWLVAQSNVAVKNIAEKLASVEFFNFKILVSKDFHYDWHEHLYQKIVKNLIRSDDFVDDPLATERLLSGSRVILCTLSMLSNNRMATISRLVPLQTVIFDEASQIEVGDYFPMLFRYATSLTKLVFIGDDKQLAPYGQGDINELKSVFEMPHLRNCAVFLDTQYRMPLPIGKFISAHVYANKLKTNHLISSLTSCQFVDVSNGTEESKGRSWTNYHERQVIISIVRKLHQANKSYRIITPYDAQRSQLENDLKKESLPWTDKCFNVDSFQGNEADYIIISVVRSKKIGFLKEMRRVNVMLTRCKKGMIICTSRSFIEGIASKTLIGKLANSLGPKAWIERRAAQYGNYVPF